VGPRTPPPLLQVLSCRRYEDNITMAELREGISFEAGAGGGGYLDSDKGVHGFAGCVEGTRAHAGGGSGDSVRPSHAHRGCGEPHRAANNLWFTQMRH